MVAPANGGPRWPYPEAVTPQIPRGGESGAVVGLIVVGVIALGAWFTAAWVLLRNMTLGVSTESAWWFIVVGAPVFLVWQGLSTMSAVRKGRERTAKHWEAITSGTPCWGRIQTIADGDTAYRDGISYVQTFKITIDSAYAAPVPSGAQRVPVGNKVADAVVLEIDAGRLPFRPAFVAQGNWCAFVLHPSDPSISLVDAFANAAGVLLPRDSI